MKIDKTTSLLFGFLIVSSILDIYLTFAYSKGVEDLLLRESHIYLLYLLKKGFSYWLSAIMIKTFYVSSFIIGYLFLAKSSNPTYTFLVSIVIVFYSINNVLGGLTWVVDYNTQTTFLFWIEIFNISDILTIILLGLKWFKDSRKESNRG